MFESVIEAAAEMKGAKPCLLLGFDGLLGAICINIMNGSPFERLRTGTAAHEISGSPNDSVAALPDHATCAA